MLKILNWMTLLAARKYLFSDISETNKFLLCVFPLILFFRKCEFVPVVLIMALAFCECHHVMMTFCFCMIFFPWHFICIYVYWQSFLRVLLMNILIQFNYCIEMVNKTCSQKHKNCEQRNFVNLRGIFNGNNITSNEMLSSDEILFILLSMRYKLFIYFGPLWGIIMLILCFQCLQ